MAILLVSILSTVHLTYICDINYMRTSRHHTHRRLLNTLRPRQNGRHFADDTFKRIFFNENVRISLKISLKFVQITYDMIVSLYGLPPVDCQSRVANTSQPHKVEQKLLKQFRNGSLVNCYNASYTACF